MSAPIHIPLSLSAVLLLTAFHANAETFGTILFASGSVEIIDAAGNARQAKRGDALQSGERIRSADNGVAQVRAWDGSFIGVRPKTDLSLRVPSVPGGESTVALENGTVRLLNADMNDGRTRAAMALKTAKETIMMTAADAESVVVKPTDVARPGAPETGSYTRLAAGKALLLTSTTPVELPIRQISFVPAGGSTLTVPTIAPIQLTAPLTFPVLSTSTLSSTTLTTQPVLTTSLLSPTLTTSTLSTSTIQLDSSKLLTTSLNTTTLATTSTIDTSKLSLSSTTLSPTLTQLSSTTLISPTITTSPTLTTKTISPIVTKTSVYSSTGTLLLR